MCNRRFSRKAASAHRASKKAAYVETRPTEMRATGSEDVNIALDQLCYKLQVGKQRADVPLRTIDGYLLQLNQLGLFNRSIVLGPVVLSRSHGIDGPTESVELIQAAITTDFGAAAVYWDSLEFQELKDSSDFEGEALDRATPLRKCASAIRAMIWPHVPAIVTKLLDRARIS